MRFEPILRKISNGGHFADVIFDSCRAIWCLFKYIKFIYTSATVSSIIASYSRHFIIYIPTFMN
jgi:hypothetical protein